MTATDYLAQDPDDRLDYLINYTSLLPANDAITSSTWIHDDGILTDSSSFTDNTTTVFVSGGTDSTDYPITNRIVTTQGRKVDYTILIRIRNQ